MNAIAHDPTAPAHSGAIGWVAALRSTTRGEAISVFAISAAIGVVNAFWLLEVLSKPDMQFKPAMVADILLPLACAPFVLVAWVLADRAEGSRLSRTARLALASAAAAVASGVLLPLALDAAGLLLGTLKLDDREVQLPLPLISASLTLNVFIDVALAFATFEMLLRRRAAQRELEASIAEQAALSRKVLQSRLAAMQAQVEPRFLFDTLVGIERLYARETAQGAAQMDRLIAYLRVALPRLRESGSTIAAEAELVQSYLAVVQAAAGSRPQLRMTIAADCAAVPLHPMLLLPLIQRAVRDAAQLPATIDLVAKRSADAVAIVLRFARGGLCDGDDELHRVQGRLAALYGPQAQLHCDDSVADATEFTLHLPAPSTA
jgi:hypothetical protein